MREKVLIVVVLFAVSTVSALMLAAVDSASRDVIIKNRERNFKVALLSVLNLGERSREPEVTFKEKIKEHKLPSGKVYLSMGGEGNKEIEGAAFKLTGSGFWGPISIMVGIRLDDMSISGIEILEQGETPGLGARIEEVDFRKQFYSKYMDKAILIKVKGEKPGANDVSAITGATITSKSFEKIINEASQPYIKALRGIKHG